MVGVSNITAVPRLGGPNSMTQLRSQADHGAVQRFEEQAEDKAVRKEVKVKSPELERLQDQTPKQKNKFNLEPDGEHTVPGGSREAIDTARAKMSKAMTALEKSIAKVLKHPEGSQAANAETSKEDAIDVLSNDVLEALPTEVLEDLPEGIMEDISTVLGVFIAEFDQASDTGFTVEIENVLESLGVDTSGQPAIDLENVDLDNPAQVITAALDLISAAMGVERPAPQTDTAKGQPNFTNVPSLFENLETLTPKVTSEVASTTIAPAVPTADKNAAAKALNAPTAAPQVPTIEGDNAALVKATPTDGKNVAEDAIRAEAPKTPTAQSVDLKTDVAAAVPTKGIKPEISLAASREEATLASREMDDVRRTPESEIKEFLANTVKTASFGKALHTDAAAVKALSSGVTGSPIRAEGLMMRLEIMDSLQQAQADTITQKDFEDILSKTAVKGKPGGEFATSTQVSRFANMISAQIKNANWTANQTKVQLAPKGLGEIEIDMSTDASGKLRATIRAENPLVLALLKEDEANLQSLLQGQGFDLSNSEFTFEELKEENNTYEGADIGQGEVASNDQTTDDIIQTITKERLDISI